MLRTDELDYELPAGLIATSPLAKRDEARMLVVHVRSGRMEHRQVKDLPEVLTRGDLLVLNETKVLPARLMGTREDTGGKVEGLFVSEEALGRWRVMLQAGGPLREGVVVALRGPGESEALRVRLKEKDAHSGEWIVEGEGTGARSAGEALERVGWTALPPYIVKKRQTEAGAWPGEKQDREVYQTVYAREEGSIAAPTAGLHFTPELLARLGRAGVERARVTLHVGVGTFKPVKTETIDEHRMHGERYAVGADAIEALRGARQRGGRVVAVGTTTARTLESVAREAAGPVEGETDLKIMPGHDWRWVDGLMTNFHLPKTTLLALVAAKTGMELWRAAYAEAVRERYRFFSFGDCMLILPE